MRTKLQPVMRTLASAAVFAVLGAAGPALAQEGVAAAPDYDDGATWLCRPGREDSCAIDLTAAIIATDGSVAIETHQAASAPAVDCFYVYPTVSLDPGANSDLEAGPEEHAVVAAQFARFSEVCRPFAPLYRQVTIPALRAAMAGEGDTMAAGVLAYGDVREAWRHYMAHDNDGRGVILVGHSQGARMLKTLIAQEIETGPAVDQVIGAYLIGYNVLVPEGEAVGGDFSVMPVCTSGDEAGCILSYVSFRDDVPPPASTRFGRSGTDGMAVACVNPAAPGSAEAAPLEAYLSNLPDAYGEQGDAATARVEERFMKLPGFLTAQCLDQGGAQYLSVTVNADPQDPRTDVLVGDVVVNGQVLEDWGLHLVDMHVAMGDLIDFAARQIETYEDR